MPTAHKTSAKAISTKKSRQITKRVVTSHRRKAPSKIKSNANKRVTNHHKEIIAGTYVFECTRPGCGYRLYHDEKHAPGQVRLDMKCPKCHNYGFKCLGKGDIPQSFNIPANPDPL